MKIPDIKNSLKSSNLVTSGIKSVLIAQIEMSVKNGISAVENLYPNIIENMAGAVFQTTAHLEMLTPDYNAVVKDKVTDNYGFQLYALIVSGSVREDHQDLAATKKIIMRSLTSYLSYKKLQNSNYLEVIA